MRHSSAQNCVQNGVSRGAFQTRFYTRTIIEIGD